MTSLRPYQQQAVDQLRANMARGIRRQLLVSPTGSGKGTLLCEVIRLTVARQKSVLFLVAGRELVDQCSERLEEQFRLDYGVIMSGHWRVRPRLPVQVASVDTLASHVRRGVPLPEADLIMAGRFLGVLQNYPRAFVIGMTATPVRADGKGLGNVFEDLVEAASVRELVDQGYLAPVTGFSYPPPDLSGVKLRGGDYDQEALGSALVDGEAGQKLGGDVIERWHARADGRRTVLFAINRVHAQQFVERLNNARHHGGPIARAEYVDGTMKGSERKAIFARIRSGETNIVCNVGILCRGVDIPSLEVAVFARPTKSLALYLQQGGRVLRPSPATGKTGALILDHAGNAALFGSPDDPRTWSLTHGTGEGEGADRKATTTTCPAPCYAIFPAVSQRCPVCSRVNVKPEAEQLQVIEDTTAQEIALADLPKRSASEYEKARELDALVRIAVTRGYKVGWAGRVYASKHGERPTSEVLAKIERTVRARLARNKQMPIMIGGAA